MPLSNDPSPVTTPPDTPTGARSRIFTPTYTESVASEDFTNRNATDNLDGRKYCICCGVTLNLLSLNQYDVLHPFVDQHITCRPENLLEKLKYGNHSDFAEGDINDNDDENDSEDGCKDEPGYIDLAPHGDLILWFTNPSWMVRVASQVLFSASTVFSDMFGLAECRQATLRRAREMELCAVMHLRDDPIAFEHVLRVLHYQPPPQEMSYANLTSIAEIALKYNLAAPLKIHVTNWIKSHSENIKKQGFEKFLTVAWVFGFEHEFGEISEELIWRARISEYGDLSFEGLADPDSGSEILPWELANGIRTLRSKRLAQIREIIFPPNIDRYSLCRWTNSEYYPYEEKAVSISLCGMLQTGHLVKTITDLGLNEEDIWRKSLREIYQMFDNIKPVILPSTGIDSIGMELAHSDRCSWTSYLAAELKKSSHLRLELKDYPSTRISKPRKQLELVGMVLN